MTEVVRYPMGGSLTGKSVVPFHEQINGLIDQGRNAGLLEAIQKAKEHHQSWLDSAHACSKSEQDIKLRNERQRAANALDSLITDLGKIAEDVA